MILQVLANVAVSTKEDVPWWVSNSKKGNIGNADGGCRKKVESYRWRVKRIKSFLEECSMRINYPRTKFLEKTLYSFSSPSV